MGEHTGELPRIGNRRVGRRAILRGAARGAAGIIGVGAVIAGGELGIPKLVDRLGNIGSEVDGKFLKRQEDGTLVINDTPQAVKVTYAPHADPNSRYWNKDNIIVHREPKDEIGEGKEILPEDIKTQYAIRVAGGAFGSSGVSRFQVTHKGHKYTVGEWFVPSDLRGNPVSLKGEPLQEGEKKYFIAASFVSVQNPSTTTNP